jgi:hypothetical protein
VNRPGGELVILLQKRSQHSVLGNLNDQSQELKTGRQVI